MPWMGRCEKSLADRCVVFVYYNPPPVTAGWTIDDISNGFIAPNQYTTNDIICHTNATAGKGVITVAAGSKIDLQWTVWPTTHHGPVISYLAPNTADSATQDKTALNFFKIDAGGLINPTPAPGKSCVGQNPSHA